jgi:hypothetical protein
MSISSFQIHNPLALSAHFFGLMWLVNLCSPYLNLLLNRPDIPTLIYAFIMGVTLFLLLVRKDGIVFRLSRFALAGGLYLLYTALIAIIWGTRQEGWGFLIQGGSIILALLIYQRPQEYRIILSWIVFGMAGYGAFLVWQSITGYLPPWRVETYFLHQVGDYARAGEGFGEKNYSGALLVIGVIIIWSMATFKQWSRLSFYAIFLASFSGIIFTFSRGAFVALGVAVACYALTSARRFKRLTRAILILTPVAFYFLENILDIIFSRFSSIRDDAQATSRWDQFTGGLDIFWNSSSLVEVFFGHGPFVLVDGMIIHNTLMGILVEQGLIGLALWVGFMAIVVRACLISFRCQNPYPLMALAAFLVSALFIRIEVERNFWIMLLFVHSIPLLFSISFSYKTTQRSTSSTDSVGEMT